MSHSINYITKLTIFAMIRENDQTTVSNLPFHKSKFFGIVLTSKCFSFARGCKKTPNASEMDKAHLQPHGGKGVPDYESTHALEVPWKRVHNMSLSPPSVPVEKGGRSGHRAQRKEMIQAFGTPESYQYVQVHASKTHKNASKSTQALKRSGSPRRQAKEGQEENDDNGNEEGEEEEEEEEEEGEEDNIEPNDEGEDEDITIKDRRESVARRKQRLRPLVRTFSPWTPQG
ncbi:hypothetical protein RFI_02116 [Reticulomyxa filosa]|uniref:Uncharacterized protein n=1 Tax=Reticulomyxa filosa TaxID=46433 RepID=X6PA05_RETFI|nr:hypothetical protein RFI_02116 [Reticulomyxa filosa]|eukprot:ETO34958.1 hypothetical protein RFI_02116 [Reticulomyxa filosa]